MLRIIIFICLFIGVNIGFTQSLSYKDLLSLEKRLGEDYKGEYFSSSTKIQELKRFTSKAHRQYFLDSIHEVRNTFENLVFLRKQIDQEGLEVFKESFVKLDLKIASLTQKLRQDSVTLELSKPALKELLSQLSKFDREVDKALQDAVEGDRYSFVSSELKKMAKKDHDQLLKDGEFTSAQSCRKCHPTHFKQWSMSQHAYAQLSPIYMSMQKAINHLTNKTNGDFCIRCHTQVGMIKNESIYASNLERHPMSREGVTCIVCHRVSPGEDKETSLEYGKVSARLALQKSDLKGRVYGPEAGEDVKKEIDESGYKKIHKNVGKFSRMSQAGFCSSCHDAVLGNGLRLEEAFSEYQNSNAAKENISCQDCHMGQIPGKAILDQFGNVAKENYAFGRISKPSSRDRKMTDHTFSGPDFTVIHPALFPHSYTIDKMGSMKDWLSFDYKAGWGSELWESTVGREHENLIYKDFWPTEKNAHRWMYKADRKKARQLILGQFESLREARRRRLQLLRHGYQFVKNDQSKVIEISDSSQGKLSFSAAIKNGINAHNVPTDLITERLIWFHVVVRKSESKEIVFQSGDLDPNGDLRDIHSFFVHNGDGRYKLADGHGAQRLLFSPDFKFNNDQTVPIQLDNQLLSLQSKFITKNIRGGEREQIIGVNHSVDTLPFIRPSTNSAVIKGQPGDVRIHRMSLPPKTSRRGEFTVDSLEPGSYSISLELKSAIVPVNLIKAISRVGFDYGMTPREVASRVVFGFHKELNSIRYYSIESEEAIALILQENDYLDRAQKMYSSALKILSEKNSKELLSHAAVRFYAETVAQKKLDYVLERISQTTPGKVWLKSSEFMQVLQRVRENPLDELHEIKTFLSEKCLSAIGDQDKQRIIKIIEVIDNHQDRESYWTELEYQRVKNGLLTSKVAGHEVLHFTQETVVVEQ
ncbi:MAG: cytochrome c family protein [Lentisphaeraceae bacterium]|nr:cytochrome c family protein [Lentisphaeraceae bacterium]